MPRKQSARLLPGQFVVRFSKKNPPEELMGIRDELKQKAAIVIASHDAVFQELADHTVSL